MPQTNPSNPINLPEVFLNKTLAAINEHHVEMARYIKSGSPDSAALEQVRVAQYASAVSKARDALYEVLRLQEQNMELAYKEDEHEELMRELDLLGL